MALEGQNLVSESRNWPLSDLLPHLNTDRQNSYGRAEHGKVPMSSRLRAAPQFCIGGLECLD